MISISHKAKQFLILAIKLLIVVGAFYFIYEQLATNDKLDWNKFIFLFKKNQSVGGILFILFLSFANRFLEILKWQNLVSSFKIITIGEATKQVLASLTAGIFTPNGIGEYAGKTLYFEKNKAKKIVFLNLLCNGIQLILTVILGTIGLLLLGYTFWVLVILALAFGFLSVAFFTKKIDIKGYSVSKFIEKLNKIPKNIHQKNTLLGIARYLIFSHQYYFLFIAFDVHLPYFTLMATIVTVYFLASALPSFQFLDFAVKGSVAVYFFSLLGVNEWIVVFVTTLMWFLNVVIPVIIGSFYVLNFKPQWKS
ncbi:Lysylphosphatidylglycerol synthase TM region [Flavobacterium swingsii]|uniref:Lysylphosphatidylglycerol synthase TM region n=1 Tax=Flavobacterium swingsii TaxID=498292 RepID=A0A1I0YK30_9FLAO|nr:lysylphosphatidylglycerol synthase domain-containing protein [Flavobacterium swingsii]SFB12678.1 Lysylphosphatidylglycerol synthase TM region [Flavobacterium swingsii]